eukprot:gnl/Ergobibamus_cyprinoides/680.p1 GENE.gnl/Ergobibamus_cyprinoides/680~~gnl/Ergobibamus_cyprinoides/680.p1  ORF type:complete len:124 (+),score=37.03 gnl/Ergobibamus_cyprinoides/680:783-1154(+)
MGALTAYGVLTSGNEYVTLKHQGDHLISWHRGDTFFIVNLHPTESFSSYAVPVRQPGKYTLVLSSDELRFGGFSRVTVNENQPIEAFSRPDPNHQTVQASSGCDHFILSYIPARTALVYRRLD